MSKVLNILMEKSNFAGEELEIYFTIVNFNIWVFLGNALTKILKYDNVFDAVRDYVTKKNCLDEKEMNWKLREARVKFINKEGLYELADNSSMENSANFKKWLNTDLFPNIWNREEILIFVKDHTIKNVAQITTMEQRQLNFLLLNKFNVLLKCFEEWQKSVKLQLAEKDAALEHIISLFKKRDFQSLENLFETFQPMKRELWYILKIYYLGVDFLTDRHQYFSVLCKKTELDKFERPNFGKLIYFKDSPIHIMVSIFFFISYAIDNLNIFFCFLSGLRKSEKKNCEL